MNTFATRSTNCGEGLLVTIDRMSRVATNGGRFGWLNTLSTTRSISCGAVRLAGTFTPLSSVFASVSWRLAVGVAMSSPT